MIFKYCAWPSAPKEDNNKDADAVENHVVHQSEHKLADTVLRCCPCVFRCRQSIGIGNDNEDETVSTTVTTANTTPVIALRLNKSTETIDKTAVNEEEYNERNKQHYSDQVDSYEISTINHLEHRDEEGECTESKSGSNSSDTSRDNRQRNFQRSADTQPLFNDNNSRSSTPGSHDVDKAFDVITHQSDVEEQDAVAPYIIPLGSAKKESFVESIVSIEDDASKGWSSEEEIKLTNRVDVLSNELIGADENGNVSDESSDEENEEDEEDEIINDVRRKSVISVISNERILIDDVLGESVDILHTGYSPTKSFQNSSSPARSISPKKSELTFSNQSIDNDERFANLESPSKRTPQHSPRKSLTLEDEVSRESSEERVASSTLPDENASVRSLEVRQSRRQSSARDSPAILIASRPHSSQAVENIDEATNANIVDNVEESVEESSANDTLEDNSARDVAFTTLPDRSESFTTLNNNNDDGSETNADPGILKIETAPIEPVKKIVSKVPRRVRPNKTLTAEKATEKSKPVVQQCFLQLDSKDWEVTLKGLKSLSQIVKQHPEYLDTCAGGTIGRLLGRHIKNLRSQVSRAACMTSADIFSSQIRNIDQDLDDIVTPLLHRTADTNRFLRADSNAALDCMIEHLPAQKTISIVVNRGSNHQNAVVRAATARLLSSIVERVGPDQAMSLPRDVRDKMLSTGARLLIDGNLDARNHAKKMFRRLTQCDGFRRALTDAVPETTLRHIDKALKSL